MNWHALYTKKNNYKPVSRILYPDLVLSGSIEPKTRQDREAIIYLVQPLLTGSFCLPTQRILCRHSDEPPFNAGIHGISACKVYPPYRSPGKAVGSYPTFSPLPSLRTSPPTLKLRRTKAEIFCGTVCSLPTSRERPGCSPVHCPMLSRLSSPNYVRGDSPVCS